MAASIKNVAVLQQLLRFNRQLLNCNRVPLILQSREKHKVNIQHPWPGHINRQVLVKVTEPIVVKPYSDPAVTCTRRESLGTFLDNLSDYEKFLIRHQKKLHAKYADGILCFLLLSPCSAKAYHKGRVMFRREGFELYRLNRKVFHHAVKDTKYETLNDIMAFSTVMLMSAEPNVKEMMSAVAKTPYMHLMCAVVEGQLLSKTQLETYATYPDRLSMVAQTCSILNQASQHTSHLLTSQQKELSRCLETYSQPES